jgi:DNA-binding IclR family transcriptional regulator
MSGPTKTPSPTAQTLDRGLQVLEAVARAGTAVSAAEAAASVGIDRTVAHRLITTLSARGYLQRDRGGRYRLGPTCLALASVTSDLRNLARPFLETLHRTTGETVHLVVLSGHDVVFIDGIEGAHALRVATRTGRVLPAHSTSVGKAWLAALSSQRFDGLYAASELEPVTPRTTRDLAALRRELDVIRKRGYATSSGESESGIGSIGVAVRDAAGEPRAAISVALPLDRWSDAFERDAAAALQAVATDLGAHL